MIDVNIKVFADECKQKLSALSSIVSLAPDESFLYQLMQHL